MTTKEEKSKTEEKPEIQEQSKIEEIASTEEQAKTREKLTTSDIKDMSNLLEDKTLLGTPLEAHIDDFTFKKYNIINPSSKAKRIVNGSTVRYYCQAYLYDENSKKFHILEKTYKNIKKDKISNMSHDKKWIRYCLLLMMEAEQTLFEINKKLLGDFYQKQVKLFFERKKKEKEKELKEIEKEKIKEQVLKEKEELKKKGELQEGVIPSKNPLPPRPKKEIKIDSNIVNALPETFKLEEKIYYRIYTEDVFIEKPSFPNKAKELEGYVKAFNAEIRRLLLKEERKEKSKREYNMAESWCNELISKIFNMSKGKLKDEYESDKFKPYRKPIEEEMKKPLLNLMYIYSKKMDNDPQIVRQAIKLVEEIYYKKFKGQYDESFLKITGRYINCLIKVNDFSKAKLVIDVMKKKCSELKALDFLLKELEPKLNVAEKKNNIDNITLSKGQIKAGLDDTKPIYDWQQGQNEEELNEALLKDVDQVKRNMELINANQ
jgi:hypothetical protein